MSKLTIHEMKHIMKPKQQREIIKMKELALFFENNRER